METELNKFRKRTVGGIAAAVLALTINHGYQGETKTMTQTYQGYSRGENKNSLVFDENTLPNRTNIAKPISADYHVVNPDTLKTGRDYTTEFTVPHWQNVFPDRLESIK
ncbi:MAG: hypothetical protein PF542_01850 [Nanoarchaeota archaeon]|jgi:hypothetical protein|nr:hypothetical protein [Nanoarchaeota archaeon]